jgi:CheY-like chemotaxis protein
VAAQPRLVILDVRMGRIDGIDIFHQLRADPATRDIPVIFFTATEQRVSNRLPNFRQLGASFVIKPNIAQLSARIEEVLANHP